MTGSESKRIRTVPLKASDLTTWASAHPEAKNWPVVYTLTGENAIYIGETNHMLARAHQHLKDPHKEGLSKAHVVMDESFNKSACRDLESTLIRLFSGDGKFEVRNRNAGIVDDDYYDRAAYQKQFEEIFDELRENFSLFDKSIPEIEQSELFKYSPFKSLTDEQGAAVCNILEALLEDLRRGQGQRTGTTSVVRGAPGTGKTIVAVFLIKLIADIQAYEDQQDTVLVEQPDRDDPFSAFFTADNADLLRGLRIGLVIPQQALRQTLQKVFKRTAGLKPDWVMNPFKVGSAPQPFDILIVDEAHRLNRRANQPAGPLNKLFRTINESLFGQDHSSYTQLDWIKAQSRYQIFLLDQGQSVRPADLDTDTTDALLEQAESSGRVFHLMSQMRVAAGQDYVEYVREVFSGHEPAPYAPANYDLRHFSRFADMVQAVRGKEAELGLARLTAGYAWEWVSNKIPGRHDIVIEGVALNWNSTDKDWINSGGVDEVGSIHTVQGYDLNVAGVIVGPELSYDRARRRIVFHRENYFDKAGMQNNRQLGKVFTDDEILEYVINIYVVLMTRGIRGTYLYVVDPALREYLARFFPFSTSRSEVVTKDGFSVQQLPHAAEHSPEAPSI